MSKTRADAEAGVAAGLLAGVVYLGEMAADLKAARHNTDDLYMLGRMVTSSRRFVRPVGLAMHLMNSAIFGLVYALVAHDRLPGPPWLRGVTLANIENAALYSLAHIEHHHPGVRNGELDSYRTRTAFLQNIARHIAFGAVLGAAYARLRTRRLITQ
jgi:hypothetical protein